LARLTFVVTGSGWFRVLASAGAVLGLLFAVALLPGAVLGDRLTPAQAERSIRSHLQAQAALRFHKRLESAPRAERVRINALYREEIRAIRQLDVVSLDVDTVLFGYTKIRRSFVVELVTLGQDGHPSTRYYCFLSGYLTGECARWNWWLAF
jgi:hypothetical protein